MFFAVVVLSCSHLAQGSDAATAESKLPFFNLFFINWGKRLGWGKIPLFAIMMPISHLNETPRLE
jgi:hypothetical protein